MHRQTGAGRMNSKGRDYLQSVVVVMAWCVGRLFLRRVESAPKTPSAAKPSGEQEKLHSFQ